MGEADEGVEVRAVVVEQSARVVHDLGHFADRAIGVFHGLAEQLHVVPVELQRLGRGEERIEHDFLRHDPDGAAR